MDDITAASLRANDPSASDSDIEVGIAQPPTKAKISGGSGGPPPNGKRPWNQGNRNSDRDGPSDAVLATWKRGDDDLEPSTKMLALLELLKEWDSCGDKTICFSQCKPATCVLQQGHTNICYWEIGTSMLDLIEILFSRHGIQSLRFDGKMSREDRDATLATFKKSGGPKVILVRYAIVRPQTQIMR
jgi:SNF2 family DNA or RNA helicase